MAAYLLCASPRSGSTLLCDLLRQAGAGQPHSFFRVKSIADWAKDWGLPATGPTDYGAEYIATAIAHGQGGTPVFGLRMMWDSMEPLFARLTALYGPADDLTLLTDRFGPMSFVHLSRRDMVAQAVSLARAEQTGLWHRNADGSILEQTKDITPASYDSARITAELTGLKAEAKGWATWFDKTGITPHRLTYESLAADPQTELAKVLSHIGLDPTMADGVRPGTAKLADRTNTDWAARYRAAHGLPPAPAPV